MSPESSPSLLDRLIDLSPGLQREAPETAWQQARNFQAALARDLTALLNTRRAKTDFDPGYEESANSLLSFGIVDFTAYDLKKGAGPEQLRRSIERAIRQFEPRLDRVMVTMEEPNPVGSILRYQVAAVLRTEAQEPVIFEAMLHRDSRRLAVMGGA